MNATVGEGGRDDWDGGRRGVERRLGLSPAPCSEGLGGTGSQMLSLAALALEKASKARSYL